MNFGYIKINGIISQIFLNKSDEDIRKTIMEIKSLNIGDINIEWNNFYTNKSLFDLETFMSSGRNNI